MMPMHIGRIHDKIFPSLHFSTKLLSHPPPPPSPPSPPTSICGPQVIAQIWVLLLAGLGVGYGLDVWVSAFANMHAHLAACLPSYLSPDCLPACHHITAKEPMLMDHVYHGFVGKRSRCVSLEMCALASALT